MDQRTCSIDGCDKRRKGRYCPMHRDRIARHGSPDGRAQQDPQSAGPCTFDGCLRPVKLKARGLCSAHAAQGWRGKPLGPVSPPATQRDDQGRKHCPKCDQWQPEGEFDPARRTGDNLRRHCRTCLTLAAIGDAEGYRDRQRETRLGVNRATFDAKFAEQGETCAICGTADPGARYWCIDHDHSCCATPGRSCGKCFRGILCTSCNTGIGMLKDDPTLMLAAFRYLRGVS